MISMEIVDLICNNGIYLQKIFMTIRKTKNKTMINYYEYIYILHIICIKYI